VFYTGGTTGFPKGVMLSHDGLCLTGLSMAAEGIAREGDRGLHAAPMFHIADVTLLSAMWAVGATHVVLPAFTPLGMLQAVERERISTTILVPTMIQMMVDHAEAPKHDLSSLRSLLYGGSPINEAVLDRSTKLLPQTVLRQIYGMTELGPLATILPGVFHTAEGRARGKIRSAGHACLGVEVRIVDAEGREVPRARWAKSPCSAPRSCWGTGTRLMKPHRPCAGTPTRAGCTPATAAAWTRKASFTWSTA